MRKYLHHPSRILSEYKRGTDSISLQLGTLTYNKVMCVKLQVLDYVCILDM